MTWADLALALGAAAAFVLVPGLVIGLVAGLRGMWLWGLSAPFGVTVISIAAVGAPFANLRWGVLPVLIALAALALIVLVLRLLIWRRLPPLSFNEANRHAWVPAVAIAAPMLIILIQVLVIVGNPQNISQTFDNVFHLNAIRYAVDQGNASPLFINSMTSAGGPAGFYPSGWHALGALVVITTNASIPVASNALTLLFPAIIWPGGILLLARVFGGSSPAFLLSAGLLAAATPAFPLLMIQYGVLFPYMMSLTLLPAAFAVLVTVAFRKHESPRADWGAVLLLLGTIPGIVVAHPGAFMALLAFATVTLAVWFVYQLRSHPSRRRIWVLLALGFGYLVALIAAWYKLRPPAAARGWPAQETVAQAIGEVFAAAVWSAPIDIAVAALAIVGCVVALRRRTRVDVVLLLVFVTTVILYVVVSGLPYWTPRDMLVGPWYNNAPRLAALLPVGWIPLGAIGAKHALGWLMRWADRRQRKRGARVIVAAAAVVVLIVLPQLTSMRNMVLDTVPIFRYSKNAPLLSADEDTLLNRLDREVPRDAEIAGSPWTGTALAYALADRRVIMPHILSQLSRSDKLIMNGINHAVPGSAVCAAVHHDHVDFVLDFGSAEVNGGRHPYRGLQDLSKSAALKLVDHVGQAKLYRVVGCS
ncbi:DUF6541 family protein [Humibacter ginsengisoli]